MGQLHHHIENIYILTVFNFHHVYRSLGPLIVIHSPQHLKKRKVLGPEKNDTNNILKLLLEKLQRKDEFIENDGDWCLLLSLLSNFKKVLEHRKSDANYEMISLIRRFQSIRSIHILILIIYSNNNMVILFPRIKQVKTQPFR